MDRIAIFGAGGHAASVVDVVMSGTSYAVACLVDKKPVPVASNLNFPIISEKDPMLDSIKKAFVAIGDNGLRKKLAEDLQRLGYILVNVVSPYAYVSCRVLFGSGIVVMPHAVVSVDAKVGDGTIINTRASVDHDCKIGSYCHVAPGATVCGFVTIGDGTFVGAGATIIDRINIGSNCMIGAGAVVVNDIPNNQTVMGVPAKPYQQRKE